MASTLSSAASQGPAPDASAAKRQVIERISVQRERLYARKAARAQALALAQHDPASGDLDESPVLRAVGFARDHPVVVAAMVGIAMMAGPRRLIRWAGVALPLLMRFKR